MEESVVKHSSEFKLRRFLNWFPMGLTYAFLYMGRYNLTVSKTALGDAMTKEDFGLIFAAGTFTYAFAFLLNGPLVDKIGGKRGILIAAMGSGICNLLMGLYIQMGIVGGAAAPGNLVTIFSLLYALNMYFQSYGAVSIVKVNAHWFHVRERGGFSGIFGTMISSGIFFAFTVNGWVLDAVADPAAGSQAGGAMWVFFLPAAILFVMFAIECFLLRDRPGQAGFDDFETGDASAGDDGSDVSILKVMKAVVTNPIILTVALIEFCTGVLRNGVMHWFPFYAKEVLILPSKHALVNGDWLGPLDLAAGNPGNLPIIIGCFVLCAVFFFLAKKAQGSKVAVYSISGGLLFVAPFMMGGWGGILMVAGVIGANVAGWVSDLFFQSRRAPAAGGLYLGLSIATIGMFFTLGGTTNIVGRPLPDDKAAADGFNVLEKGDVVVEVAGSKVEEWADFTRAVACVPPTACEDSTWDMEECLCKSSTENPMPEGTPVTAGFIPVVVERDGKRADLKLRDPSTTMRAGDKRKIKVGPVLILSPYFLGIIIFLMSLCVIGTHGLLSGTATMDFGGRRGAATAVGMIDGFVYLGTGLQSVVLGYLTTRDWSYWPLFLFPFSVVGFLLSLRIWNAKPGSKGGGH